MASNVQLPLTWVAQTGTGLLYAAYSQGPDQVIWQNGSGATRSRLTLNRTQPKPTADFPGVDRLEYKINQFFTVNDVEYQSVLSLVSSIPVVADSAHRTAMKERISFLTHETTWNNALDGTGFPT
jgi:hypothetical protein